MTTNQDHHSGAEDHQGRSGGTGDHHSVAEETGELVTATLAETKQAGRTRKITMVITGQAGSSVSASVAIVEPPRDTESSEAASHMLRKGVCSPNTQNDCRCHREHCGYTVDNGSTSGTDSAKVGRLESVEAGGLESVGIGMLAARADNQWWIHHTGYQSHPPEKDLVTGMTGEDSGVAHDAWHPR